ncbi:MAG TPA: hypothetical protein VG328_03210, partial [Stellaceae bacterium]|nr:hypothetical protein [Stellaceae bacterium]
RISGATPMKAEMKYPYVLDCWTDLNADTSVNFPAKQDGFNNLADAVARAEVVWKARDRNGFKKLVVCFNEGNGWLVVETWPNPSRYRFRVCNREHRQSLSCCSENRAIPIRRAPEFQPTHYRMRHCLRVKFRGRR